MAPNPAFDLLNLLELADRLADVRTTKTHEGFKTDNAVIKAGLERRIMDRVTKTTFEDASRIQIDHGVSLTVQGRELEADRAEICIGGIFVPGKADFKDGAQGVIEVKAENDFKIRVKCVVRDRKSEEPGVFVAFESLDDSSMRRATRLILELLKNPAT